MKLKVQRVTETILFISIIALSIFIFLHRDMFANVGSVGYVGVMVLCFLANSTVLLPAPSLLLAGSCAMVLNPFLVAVFAALGSSLGELVGYAFGSVSKSISPQFKVLMDKLAAKIKSPYFFVFLLAALPLPLFDLIGIYSGGTKMNPFKFFVCCYLGKFVKLLVTVNAFGFAEDLWSFGR